MVRSKVEVAKSKEADGIKEDTNETYAERKERMKKITKAEKAVKECESKIAAMEKRIAELNNLLMNPANASDMTLVSEYTSTQRALDAENERWMERSEELEKLAHE